MFWEGNGMQGALEITSLQERDMPWSPLRGRHPVLRPPWAPSWHSCPEPSLTRSRKPSGQVNWSYQMALYMIRTQPMSAMAKAIMRAVGSCGVGGKERNPVGGTLNPAWAPGGGFGWGLCTWPRAPPTPLAWGRGAGGGSASSSETGRFYY